VTSFLDFWKSRTVPGKTGLVVGIVFILALTVSLGLWTYRTDYQVLFADLSPRDAASMTAELDRTKTPYQLADGGNTILVQKELVYKTRLKLMEKDLPLHGAVGFEVFNNADFGMTEFVQKVNYQRAIQGELTRTILSIEEIQAARVHLATPEQGLFKKQTSKAKASVTVTMKSGKSLTSEQVSGIQRLVAASVPDIASEDVTVLDQHGIALTRTAGAEAETASGSNQLDFKRSTEEYLMRKVTQILDRTLGPGQAIASVDVSLNLDQSRVTTEEVLPAKLNSHEGIPTGVVVRERQTTHESKVNTAGIGNVQGGSQGDVTSIESDYQVGRRVEHVVSAAGAVRRMTVAVVVKKPLGDAQVEKLKEVVALALGASSQRGDAVVVTSLDRMVSGGLQPEAEMPTTERQGDAPPNKQAIPLGHAELAQGDVAILVLGVLFAVTAVSSIWYLRRRNRPVALSALSEGDRERMLMDIRHWIELGAVTSQPKILEPRA
jgi:flagellar M-ring protein FliF